MRYEYKRKIKSVPDTKTLFRGSRPYSVSEKIYEGIKCFIDLQLGTFELFHDDPYEIERRQGDRSRFVNFDLSSILPPRQEVVDRVLALLTLNELRGDMTFIHCLKGQDRTGYVIAAYRMSVQGWTFHEAVSEMVAEGFSCLKYWYWLFSLRRYAWK